MSDDINDKKITLEILKDVPSKADFLSVSSDVFKYEFIDLFSNLADISSLSIDYLLSFINIKVEENDCLVTPIPVEINFALSSLSLMFKSTCEGTLLYNPVVPTTNLTLTKPSSSKFYAINKNT